MKKRDSGAEIPVVLVSDTVLLRARALILGCNACGPEDADIPFDWLLDELYGAVECPLSCPCCGATITEKTPVEF